MDKIFKHYLIKLKRFKSSNYHNCHIFFRVKASLCLNYAAGLRTVLMQSKVFDSPALQFRMCALCQKGSQPCVLSPVTGVLRESWSFSRPGWGFNLWLAISSWQMCNFHRCRAFRSWYIMIGHASTGYLG